MRIIAGSAKGRHFEAPAGRDTRPTLDRVKEAIFGSIQFRLLGATVLDLFSGSGNMGLEALSRGARAAICVDVSPVCAALIRQNGEKLGLLQGLTVVCGDYSKALSTLSQEQRQVDIAFLDPPYASDLAAAAVNRLFTENILSPGGVVVVEHAYEEIPVFGEGSWQVLKTKKYGICGVTTLAWKENA